MAALTVVAWMLLWAILEKILCIVEFYEYFFLQENVLSELLAPFKIDGKLHYLQAHAFD
jgi:hypothetical protein